GRHRRGSRDREAVFDAALLAVHQRYSGWGAQGPPAAGRGLVKRGAAALLTLLIGAGARAAEERAVYRATGQDARLFDQYDNDGYSLSVTPAADGSLEL